MERLSDVLAVVAVVLVFCGAVPLLSAMVQFLLVGLHRFRRIYDRSALHLPRTAVLIPAWNEGRVLDTSVRRLLDLNYPSQRLRVYVVDDASTDDTPEVMATLTAENPGRVRHLRREHGGQGKAHTLNHGLAKVLEDPWTEAVLIMDADVLFDRDALWRMTRHLVDPQVGAVTAYIKEGSGRHGNYLSRFIGFEYINAQAAARRAQNVLGVVACLAGGAQLHSRANLEALGGQINADTLAEDTVTTFESQVRGRRVVFDGFATVFAEEPRTLLGLWKQRLRWARGNIQVTARYRALWFRGRTARGEPGIGYRDERELVDPPAGLGVGAGRYRRPRRVHRLGSVLFGLNWFALLLTPVLLVVCSGSLLYLYLTDQAWAWRVFHWLWVLNLACYLFIVLLTLAVDPRTGVRTWREALLFPGLVNVLILLITAMPRFFEPLLEQLGVGLERGAHHPFMFFVYGWLALCLPIAWLGKVVAGRKGLRWLAPPIVFITGYGPLLAACTAVAFVKEVRGTEITWDKTEKAGTVSAEG